MAFKVPEQYRFTTKTGLLSLWASNTDAGNNGVFIFNLTENLQVRCIASCGMGWEHVSVSVLLANRKDRCPYWEEMCKVKDLFWDEDDCVIQYHPPKADYVSQHQYCLHLWRPIGIELPRPDPLMVGLKNN